MKRITGIVTAGLLTFASVGAFAADTPKAETGKAVSAATKAPAATPAPTPVPKPKEPAKPKKEIPSSGGYCSIFCVLQLGSP